MSPENKRTRMRSPAACDQVTRMYMRVSWLRRISGHESAWAITTPAILPQTTHITTHVTHAILYCHAQHQQARCATHEATWNTTDIRSYALHALVQSHFATPSHEEVWTAASTAERECC